jgi:uncharacterized protein
MDTANQWAVWAVEVLLHNKCRTLFSMLFGVSIFLVGGERSDKARGAILRRRLLVLAIFGLLHGLALWFGDILLLYAWSGVFMMLCRSWSPKRLLWTGIGLVAAFTLLELGGEVFSALQPHDEAKAIANMPKHVAEIWKTVETRPLGLDRRHVRESEDVGARPGDERDHVRLPDRRADDDRPGPVQDGLSGRTVAGMGLWADAGAGDRDHGGLRLVRLAHLVPGYAPPEIYIPRAVLDALAPFCTLAYVGLLVLMTRYGLGWLTRRLAPVGRMAFTNYLTQTIIMTSLFYMPWGPLLYGKVEPAPLWGIVGGSGCCS